MPILAPVSSEPRPFNPVIDNDDALRAAGLIPVGVLRPSDTVYPGIQLAVDINAAGRPVLENIGLTVGERKLRWAAAHIIRQSAYDSGLPPGHAGLHGDRSVDAEVLASLWAKAALLERAGGYVGHLLMLKETLFDRTNSSGAPAISGVASVSEVVGLTMSDVNVLMGPGGIDGLRDPVEIPDVRLQLIQNQLRLDAQRLHQRAAGRV